MPAPLSVLDKIKIADGLASGQTQTAVAATLGKDPATINRKAKELKPMIEAFALAYLGTSVPSAIKLNLDCLARAQDVYDRAAKMDDKPRTERIEREDGSTKIIRVPAERSEYLAANAALLVQAHKIGDRVLQSVGIAPSLAPSVVVQNFIQIDQVTVIDPRVAGMFTPDAMARLRSEPIDVEWEDMTGDGDPA